MIVTIYKGRLGNLLFIACMARILAEKTGLYLQCPSIDGFLNIGDRKGRIVKWPERICQGHLINLDIFDDDKFNKKIILDGYFQNYSYLKPYKEVIRNDWCKISYPRVPIDDDTYVIHIRWGDQMYDQKHPHNSQPIVPFRWYKKILQDKEFKKIILVTESPNNEMVQKIMGFYKDKQVVEQHSSVMEDFMFLVSAKRMIMSCSTYSWWGAFLSDATEIHYPMTGFWHPKSKRTDINTLVDDEERYIYHDLGVQDNWHGPNNLKDILSD